MIGALPRVALQLWIVLFILFFGAEIIHLEPGLRVITQVLYGVPLAAWAAWRLRGPRDRLDWTVLGLLAVFAVVCLASRDRTESLGTLGLATAYASWFLLMRRADASGLSASIIVAAATGLTLTVAFNAYLLIEEKIAWFAAAGAAPLEGVATFPWESVNALPILVLVATPFIAGIPQPVYRAACAIVLGLGALVVVPLSLGRAGWLGLGVFALALGALHPATARFVTGRSRGARLVAATAVVIVGAVSALVVGPKVVTAIRESGRLLLWQQDLSLISRSPLLGSGPGTYSWIRLELPPAAADLLAVRLTHSVPLQTANDGGLLLVASLTAAIAVWSWRAWQGRDRWGSFERFSAAALIGFAAATTLDDFSYLPAIIAAALALAAFLVPVAPSSPVRGWVLPLAFGLAAVLALPSIVAVDSARASAQEGRALMIDGSYGAAAGAFEDAIAAHPENGGYWLGLGMARAWAGEEDAAMAAYERASAVSPGDPRAYAALAALGAGDQVELLAAASERTLGDPQYAVRLGIALAAGGDVDGATEAWGRAVSLQPELLRLLPYEGTDVSIEAVATVARRVIGDEPRPAPSENFRRLWDIALALDELPSDAAAAWRAVDAARHGDLDTARGLADAAVAAAPTDARAYQASAAVAAFACDRVAEERALDREAATGQGWSAAEPEPRIRREFVFREASLGPSQPPAARDRIAVERWPWALVQRPQCSP